MRDAPEGLTACAKIRATGRRISAKPTKEEIGAVDTKLRYPNKN